jgi:YQGE family putative transporter
MRDRGSPWRKLAPALAMQGVREGVFIFLIGLLVYIATGNEMKLGNYSLITSAVSLGAFYAAGRWLKPERRYAAMLCGAFLITAVIVPFFRVINYVTLLIFGVGVSLFFPLYIIPITSTVFDYIGRDKESASQRVEYVVLREVSLNAGRMLGTILFLFMIASGGPDALHLNVFLLAIGSAPIFSWLFMRTILKRYERERFAGRMPGYE